MNTQPYYQLASELNPTSLVRQYSERNRRKPQRRSTNQGMSHRESETATLFHAYDTVDAPIEALNHRGEGGLDNSQPERGTGAPSSPTPERQEVETLSPHVHRPTVEKPLGPELERVFPVLGVSVDRPDVDEHSGLFWDFVAGNVDH